MTLGGPSKLEKLRCSDPREGCDVGDLWFTERMRADSVHQQHVRDGAVNPAVVPHYACGLGREGREQ